MVDIVGEIKHLFSVNIIFICFGDDLSNEELTFWMKQSDDTPFVERNVPLW